ncbi:glutaredoxin domain-containing protein [Peptoniphilus raoultii]|uniref:glutaredoxin domain-containing protein n=1 Tax=Peptoniphilus raoultii TaxID=1776387 RepID=UPI0008DA4C94|nr:glutaredoxin domain-containing protein [Peptoniphilus raoultii]
MIKLFISSLCPDCPAALDYVKKHGIKVQIIDITSSMKALKFYLKYRDRHPYFKSIKRERKVGVPLFMIDNGRRFYTLEEFSRL